MRQQRPAQRVRHDRHYRHPDRDTEPLQHDSAPETSLLGGSGIPPHEPQRSRRDDHAERQRQEAEAGRGLEEQVEQYGQRHQHEHRLQAPVHERDA
jgi:hypothetical protein